MTVLSADDLSEVHTYLAENYPTWERSMESITEEGGPWWCPSCQSASYLTHRCSRCGRDLAGNTSTHGRE